MAKRKTPHSPIPGGASRSSIKDAREALSSLGGFGEGLGKLLESVAELSENGGSTKEGEFSIGGPDRKTKGAYRMQFGTLEDAIAKRQGSAPRARKPVKPFKPAPNQVRDEFAPDVFESASSAMIVAEAGQCTRDDIAITVNDDGRGATIVMPGKSGAVAFGKPVDPDTLTVSLVNGILTANISWKE